MGKSIKLENNLYWAADSVDFKKGTLAEYAPNLMVGTIGEVKTTTTSSETKTLAVTFDTPFPDGVVPNVYVTVRCTDSSLAAGAQNTQAGVTNVTNTGFTFKIYKNSFTTANTYTGTWLAIA